jgi:ABC-2 type transport system permease protein
VFFLFFAAPATGVAADVGMATFAGFAAIGVAFFQFGVGIAVERNSPWETYVRTLPVTASVRLAARLLSAAGFAAASAAVVIVVAIAATPASLPAALWLELAAVLVAGVAPFALLGVAIGYWAPPRAALPLANLTYLVLSYAGGLWFRPERLPRIVGAVSPFLPTHALADVLVGAVLGSPPPWGSWCALAGFAALFGLLAAWGYRRDEIRRYR